MWRNNLGQSVTLPNDSTPGAVTQADYDVWRAHFGQTAGSGSSSAFPLPPSPFANAVPEPASMLLLFIVSLSTFASRRGRCFNRTAALRDTWAKEAAKE